MLHFTPVKIRHLYLSPGHNFWGRDGQSPEENPIHERAEVECVAGHGIRGDRFFDFKENYKGQITFFSKEVYDALCAELAVTGKPASAFCRNVITEGVDLNTLVGQDFEVQGVRFRGTSECSPCNWMNVAFAPGAEEFLQQRGGLRAMILTDGKLRVNADDV